MRSVLGRKTKTLIAAGVTAALLSGFAPAIASAKEKPLDRKAAIQRAKTWTSARVKYSQKGYRDGYRRDCSGFVSMAWDLPENLVTWRIPLVAKRIGKKNLLPGDVLLDHRSNSKHVVMFERWANKSKTKIWVLESTGQDGVERAVRRVVPYPYRVNKAYYKPYRYVSMDNYYKRIPKRDRQPVEGYRGRVVTPHQAAVAKRKAAEAKRKALVAERQADKAAAEKKRKAAEKAAAKRAAEQAEAAGKAAASGALAASAADRPRPLTLEAAKPQQTATLGVLLQSLFR